MKKVTARDVSRIAQNMYISGSWPRRMMIYARPYICPFEELVASVPSEAAVLDVGCGDGLFLNTLCHMNKLSSATGFDTNSIAIDSAREARRNTSDVTHPKFVEWSIENPWPEGEFDVVSMIDVLHHVPLSGKKVAIQTAASRVKSGGLLLFKDIGDRPKWRALFNSLHDFVLTGERVTYTPMDVVISWVESMGLKVKEKRTINRLWYGHEMIIFSK